MSVITLFGASTLASPSFSHLGGTGRKNMLVSISTTNLPMVNSVSRLIDGFVSGSNTTTWFTAVTGDGSASINFDWGTHRPVIDGIRWRQTDASTHGLWNWEGSDDGTIWTTIQANFTLGGSTSTDHLFTNSTRYRYYRMRHMSGNRSTVPYLQEIDFRISGIVQTEGLFTNTGGSGDRRSLITLTNTGLSQSGTLTTTIDGVYGNGYYWTGSAGNGTQNMKFDFGAGNTPTISGFIQNQDTTNTHGIWNFEGSNDDTNWNVLLANHTLGGSNAEVPVPNDTGYRYYRFRHLSGNTSIGPYIREWDFRIRGIP